MYVYTLHVYMYMYVYMYRYRYESYMYRYRYRYVHVRCTYMYICTGNVCRNCSLNYLDSSWDFMDYYMYINIIHKCTGAHMY